MWLLVVLLALVMSFDGLLGLLYLGSLGWCWFLDYREEIERRRRGRV